jgi:hypothetical protein
MGSRDAVLLVAIASVAIIQLIRIGIEKWRESWRKSREQWETQENVRRERERQEEILAKKQRTETLNQMISWQRDAAARFEGVKRAEQLQHRQNVEDWDWKK